MSSRKNRREELRRRAKRRGAEKGQRREAGGLLPALAAVQEMIDRGRMRPAYERLQALDVAYPRNRQVLRMLALVGRETDQLGYHAACRRMIELDPADREARLLLADAQLRMEHLALARATFRQFAESWPGDPRVTGVRKTLSALEAELEKKRLEVHLAPEDGWDILAVHEQVQVALGDRDFERAIALADQVLSRYPQFEAPANNRVEALFQLGRLEDAIAQCRQVVEHSPHHGFALATLARLLFIQGEEAAARDAAARLKLLGPRMLSWSCKTAETLSMLGDDQGVLDACQAARAESEKLRPPVLDVAMLHHFAAAALLRQGHEDESRKMWKNALEWFPGLAPAEQNLADLRRPVGQRHAPWGANAAMWLPAVFCDEMERLVQSGTRQTDEFRALRERLVRRFPFVTRLVPALLERGDPLGRTIAWWIASLSDDPPMLAAQRTFALSQNGPDKLRMDTLIALQQKRALPERQVRVWHDGQWRDQLLLSCEIHSEAVARGWPDEAEQLSLQAMQAIDDGKPELAESLLERALELCPDAPELLNNLGAVYSRQGRDQEAEMLAYRIHRDHPDYLFGRTNLAVLRALQGDIEPARELLKGLLERTRLHVSEFSAVCFAEATVAKAEGKPDVVRQWADSLRKVRPDDPHLEIIRRWLR